MPSERTRWVHQHRDRVLRLANVVGCGWGRKRVGQSKTEQEGLVVFVRRKLPRTQLKRADIVPRQIADVPTDVIEIGDVKLLAVAESVDRTGRMRPAAPGISIGHVGVSAGTFGALVRDATTGERFILSNNHVLANQTDGRDERAQIGDPVLQPGAYDGGTVDGDVIGYLERFAPVRPIVSLPSCSIARSVELMLNIPLRLFRPQYEARLVRRADTDNIVDCAIAKPVEPTWVTANIVDVGRVKGMVEAEVGMKVLKSGRSSGVTSGEIVALGTTINVGLGGGTIARFADQIVTTPMAAPGDSGSLVLDDKHRAVGLLFAGSQQATLCNRIQAVCEALGVRM